MNKKIITLAIFCIVQQLCFAQGSFNGRIIDDKTKQPLSLATVTVFKAADTTIVAYKLSNENGDFKLNGIPLNTNCNAVITYSGYKVYRYHFTLADTLRAINIGTISLTADSLSLDEVLVVAERPPMIVKKDTIEFNAASFKMLPNAMVEDLLKKLPGVTVDKSGNISVGGKRVNKILVDGKSFFGEDPKMASRNLPSYVIDKVQVTDDKDELLRNGDDNLNNAGKVINLTFKKGYKKGLFGKAYAGGGGGENGGRYEGGAIANIFKDTMQLSVLGYTNNLNRPGFSYSDIMQAGGMNRIQNVTGNQSTSINNSDYGSGITVNGINFGGMSNQGGVSASNGLGLNFNHSSNKKKSFFAQYFFGNVKTDLQLRNHTQITNGDTVTTNNATDNGNIINNAHNFGAGINLKPDSVTTIVASANYIIGKQNTDLQTVQHGINNMMGNLNDGLINKDFRKNNQMFTQRFSYTRLSKTKKGRRFTISDYINRNNNTTNSYTSGNIKYFYPTAYDSILGQYRREKVPTFTANIAANYSEPLAKNFFVRVGTLYQFEKLKNNTTTFNKGTTGFDVLNNELTSSFERNSNRFAMSVGLEYSKKDLSIKPGVRYQTQKFDNRLSYIDEPVVQKISNLLPQLNIRYKNLEINYNRDVVLPSYVHLIPVRNNTNPYLIKLGNAGLLPALQDEVQLNYYSYSPKTNLNVWAWSNVSITNNDVIQNITMSENGVQTILPKNADGTKKVAGNFGINKQYKSKQKFTYGWNIGGYADYKQNLFEFNQKSSKQNSSQLNGWSGIDLNWNDVLEWNNRYSFGYNRLTNTNAYFTTFENFENTVGTELIVRWPKHVIFETQLSYGTNGRMVEPAYRKYTLWNAALNFTMLKDERGVLKLAVNDLLNQSRNVWASSSQNTVTTQYNNIMGQYFMATFTYNIRANGAKKKVGGADNILF